jgi:histidine triad (HIT) family protein
MEPGLHTRYDAQNRLETSESIGGESVADCIFCEIEASRAPAHRVCEDERTLVFMDKFPVADGHTLIIPRRHATNIFETEEEDLRAVVSQSLRVAHAIREVLAPDGLSVFQLNGAAAGQTVFHYHMHLIPRMQGDSLRIHGRRPGDANRLEEIAAQLGRALGAEAGG